MWNKNKLIIKSELRVLHLSSLDAFRLVSLIDALWRESLKTCISTGDTPFNLCHEIKLSLSGQIILLEKRIRKLCINNFETEWSLHVRLTASFQKPQRFNLLQVCQFVPPFAFAVLLAFF